MGKVFCSNCGTELTDNAKFCFSCGAKINSSVLKSEEQKMEKENSILKNLYYQYKDIICEEVVAAYVNNINIGLNLLYQKGKSYYFSKEMVDKVVEEQNKKLDDFIKYLSTLYINGSLLMLDMGDYEIDECIQYAMNIELDKNDAQALYDYFIKVNHKGKEGHIKKTTIFL